MRKLSLDDIQDLRAYEREREEFRRRVIALKKRRRVPLGDLMTLVFENTDTMRFQIQEMARIERIITDEAIQGEIDTYNELIPGAGELSATLLVELTTDALLREWLPKLRGIEHSIAVQPVGTAPVPAEPEDEERLTRDDITSTVHYLKFRFDAAQSASVGRIGTAIVADHPEYRAVTELSAEQRAELARDLETG